jgi:hypothetical protein
MTFSDIQKALFDWVSGQTGLPTIWMIPNFKRPNTPYIGLFIVSCVKYGATEHLPVNSQGVATLRTLQSLVLSIHVFDGFDSENISGAGICSTLLRSLSKESVLEFFNGKNLSPNVGQATINNAPEIKGTQFEQRWVLDIPIYYLETDTDAVGLIEHAEVKGVFNNNDYNADIEV